MENRTVERQPAAQDRTSRGGRRARSSDVSEQTSMTPKEVISILRRHALLIIFTTLLGFCLGGATWHLLKTYWPSYTAQTFIEVLPPVEEDPTKITPIQVNKDIQYGYRVSLFT